MNVNDPAFLLLVEDNDLDVEFVRRLIKKLHVEVTLLRANNGEDALNILSQVGSSDEISTPIAIIIDIHMPRMGGIELLQTISEHEELANVPCYVLSSSTLHQDKDNAAKHGAKNYFIKPITAEQLLELLATLLEKQPGT